MLYNSDSKIHTRHALIRNKGSVIWLLQVFKNGGGGIVKIIFYDAPVNNNHVTHPLKAMM